MASLLSTESLPDCFRVFANGLVGEANEDRNGGDQQQAHHQTRAADKPPGALDVMDVWAVAVLFVFHRFSRYRFGIVRARRRATQPASIRRLPIPETHLPRSADRKSTRLN